MKIDDKKCLYRCWKEGGQKMQACYPHNSGFCKDVIENAEAKGLKEVIEPLKSQGGKFQKFQIINCKYPECL